MEEDLKLEETKEEQETENVCPICHDALDLSVANHLVTRCNHAFHSTCLMQWISTNKQDNKCRGCPLCTRPLFEHQQTEKQQIEEQKWFDANGQFHREEVDEHGHVLPAVIHANKDKEWYQHGLRHRDHDLPAIEYGELGSKMWYRQGQLHRDGGPAVEHADGHEAWYQQGQRHRDNNLPALVHADGYKAWYQHGLRHRTDGPAVIYPSMKEEWWYQGKQCLFTVFGYRVYF